jgi:hypothetical protein
MSHPLISVVGMFDRTLDTAEARLDEVLAKIEPEVLDSRDAQALVERSTRLERKCAAIKAAARKIAASGAWRSSGERTAANWMAKATGTSVGQALGVLKTAEALKELPSVDKSFRAGKLSEIQAKEVASAAAAAPRAEKQLLKAAATEDLASLRDTCARVRAAALPDEKARYERVRKNRMIRHWRDGEGAFRMEASMTPDAGATILAALKPVAERIRYENARRGVRESDAANLADALVEIAQHYRDCDEAPVGRGADSMIHVVVDHAALVRGTVLEGETCEIQGVGPVAAVIAQAMAADSYVSPLVSDGKDIKTIAGLERTVPARVRRALIARGRICAVPGCGNKRHLEIDHINGDRNDTKLDNLDWLCPHHHYLKTIHGYVLGGAPGNRTWTPPVRSRPPPARPRRRGRSGQGNKVDRNQGRAWT